MTTTPERTHPMTAPVSPTLYGPDGRAITPQPLRDDWAPVRTEGTATVWERPRLVPNDDDTTTRATQLLATAQAEADQLLADARQEADQARTETRNLNARTIANAEAEARRIREAATQVAKQKTENAARIDKWMARAVIAGAVGLTASGEFMLARLAHFPWQVAWLLPFVIDVYVIQAFRRHRDIAQAILLTVAANVVYHLAAAGMLGVTVADNGDKNAEWWLIALVASVASVILWRMHVITAPPKPAKEKRRRRDVSRMAGETNQTRRGETGDTSGQVSPRPGDTQPETSTNRGLPPSPRAEVSPVSDVLRTPGETRETYPGETSETSTRETRETSPAETRETSPRETRETKEPRHRETSRKPRPRKVSRPAEPRETNAPRNAMDNGDREDETTTLLNLMRSRGDAKKVSLSDAIAETGRPKATAAKRLKAARDLYLTETT